MPNGVEHEILRKRGRLMALPLSFVFPLLMAPLPLRSGAELTVGIGMLIGYEIGKFCTPDWDCVTATTDESEMINKVPILGHFLFGISSTYGSIFRRRHRSFITHFPFLSTSIRHLFLFWWIWWQIYISERDLAWAIFLFIGIFIGNSLSDAVHYLADKRSEV